MMEKDDEKEEMEDFNVCFFSVTSKSITEIPIIQ
jgi:hypothetical protein